MTGPCNKLKMIKIVSSFIASILKIRPNLHLNQDIVYSFHNNAINTKIVFAGTLSDDARSVHAIK